MTSRLYRRVVEIDSLGEFDAIAAASDSMDGWRVRHVDLSTRTDALVGLAPAGALFLGCTLDAVALIHLEAGGALVYPEAPDAPVDEYRRHLYTAGELYHGLADHGYAATPDAAIYAWSQRPGDSTVRAAHDASIDAALGSAIDELTAGDRRVVGVMGGHAARRGSPGFRAAAVLGRRLTQLGLVVATGGGPGAMEAANLGAGLADGSPADLDEALAALAAVPSFDASVGAWAASALAVAERWSGGSPSIGVPTWFYGHEPTNVFATAIAKFLQSSVREATLLNRCTGGIVFLPGAAGTVQEIFADACENYYADAALVAPMVLVGVRHWTEELPAWPLLSALAVAGRFSRSIGLVDDVVAAAELVAELSGRPAQRGIVEPP